jgi:hypothetical protein
MVRNVHHTVGSDVAFSAQNHHKRRSTDLTMFPSSAVPGSLPEHNREGFVHSVLVVFWKPTRSILTGSTALHKKRHAHSLHTVLVYSRLSRHSTASKHVGTLPKRGHTAPQWARSLHHIQPSGGFLVERRRNVTPSTLVASDREWTQDNDCEEMFIPFNASVRCATNSLLQSRATRRLLVERDHYPYPPRSNQS